MTLCGLLCWFLFLFFTLEVRRASQKNNSTTGSCDFCWIGAFLWVLLLCSGGDKKGSPRPPNKITLEGIVNCKLNEVLLCNVATKMYPSFWTVHGNRNDLIARVGPVVLEYYSHVGMCV